MQRHQRQDRHTTATASATISPPTSVLSPITTTPITTAVDDDTLERVDTGLGGVHIVKYSHREYDCLWRGVIVEEEEIKTRIVGGEVRVPEGIALRSRRRELRMMGGLPVVGVVGEETQTHAKGGERNERTTRSSTITGNAKGTIHTAKTSDSAPSSPPALSYSKSSSKSSSSSNQSEEDDEFSEIALNGREDNNLPPASRPTLRRAPPSHARSHLPRGGGGEEGVRRTIQRAASGPTAIPIPHAPQSTSPSSSPRFVSSPSALLSSRSTESLATINHPHPHPHPHLHLAPHRRPSWQPGRKTIHELEAECNDDDDEEEVPDGAILENVPISPMPGQHLSLLKSPRTSSTSLPSLRSPTPSPHRRPSYANLHSANIPKHAKRPSAPPTRNAPRLSSPRSPHNGRPQMMPHSATTGQLPPSRLGHLPPSTTRRNRQVRAKSWTEDLNEEARQLSHALFELADRSGNERKHHSMHNTPSSSPPRPDMKHLLRSKTSIAQLPTVPDMQKGNIMIDPLPISKEKEAVLTRTRPSWLPPKDQKEEKRHLKEFQQMMAKATETEKKRVAREQEMRETQVELNGNIARIWEQHVLPNWDAVIKEPRTRELWWRGITPRNRGEVWARAVGNELELSEASFEAALKRAHAVEKKIENLPEEELSSSKEAAWFEAIKRDIPTVFPEEGIFEPGTVEREKLKNVLMAFTMYRSDVGYVYGTHLIAGVCCSVLLPAGKAFVLLANLLNRALPLAFLVNDEAGMGRAYELTLGMLRYKFPRLAGHFLQEEEEGVKGEEWMDPMFRCLFAFHLPLGLVSRIWDVYVFEGDRSLIRAAVGCLGRLEGRLYGGREEVLGLLGWGGEEAWDLGEEEDFVMGWFREAGKVVDLKEESAGGRRVVSA